MELLVLGVVLIAAVAIGVALAKGVLALALHLLIARGQPARGPFRAPAFLGALINLTGRWRWRAARTQLPAATSKSRFSVNRVPSA